MKTLKYILGQVITGTIVLLLGYFLYPLNLKIGRDNAIEANIVSSPITNTETTTEVPIFEYHMVGDPPNCALGDTPTCTDQIAVKTSEFEKQMKYLVDNGYTFYFTYELIAKWQKGESIPGKAIAITFDDAEKVVYTNAWPILKKYNIKFNIYPIVNETGLSYRFSWEQLKEVYDSGLANIGSHTMNHTPLITGTDDPQYEIQESKKQIEQHLNIEVKSFSFPRGEQNEAIGKMIKNAGYMDAVTTDQGKATNNSNQYLLPRINIERNVTIDNFIDKIK